MKIRHIFISLILMLMTALVFSGVARAVNPDELLSDPALEARARAISENLRCMVCQNETIDDSNAPLARDLRLLVRERLTHGDSDRQVTDYIVARYGEFVLLTPRFSSRTFILWSFPVFLLLVGAVIITLSARRQAVKAKKSASTSAEEEKNLSQIIEKYNK